MTPTLTKLVVCGDGLCDVLDDLPLAYIELDAEGRVRSANRAARTAYPGPLSELIGSEGWGVIAPEQQDLARADFFAHMASGEEPPVIRRSIYVASGSFRTFELHRSLIRNAGGHPIGMRIAGVDVTEAYGAHEEARRARMWLESVIESVGDAVIVTDALGFVRSINQAATDLTGWTPPEIFGKAIDKALPVLSYSSPDSNTLDFRVALTRRCHGIATLLDRHRRELQVEISASPILDKNNGCTIGVVGILRKVEEAA